MRRPWSRWVSMAGAALTALFFSLSPGGAVMAAGTAGSVAPNSSGSMDCNGHSPVYTTVKVGMGPNCVDPLGFYDGQATRFNDNGHYVGHDEPSVKFISSQAGSANNITYLTRLAINPKATPTVTSPKVSSYAELSPAPWWGLPICDPKSYPQNPCTPDSDTNSGVISNPNAAGSAFMELQLYAPGFQPFIDSVSCDKTHWCAAMTIDSLECTFAFATCNNNCIEPVNFAYLQMDGKPAGPPSPQLTDTNTFFPNGQTLLMNSGDVLAVTMKDTPQGLENRIDDLTTHRSGFMIASAANGFMNTNIADCTGTPFTFHPEYSSAQQQNQVPWAALEGGVLMQQELGHFEPCSSLANQKPVNQSFADGQSFSDPNVFQSCVGGLEGPGSMGEGPCDVNTGVCQNVSTEAGTTCPSNNFTSNALCEFSDANCMPAGPRTTTVNGTTETFIWPIAGCQDNFFQNGDLDFDGSSYQHDWPDGSPNHPSSFQYLGPFTNGHTYPNIQFESNVGASENACNTATGAGCTNPPTGAAFYPFFSLNNLCLWNFGDNIPGVTKNNFGMQAEYGTPDVARFGGTSTSAVLANPELSCQPNFHF